MRSTRIAPAWRAAESKIWSEPARLPVCELAARVPASVILPLESPPASRPPPSERAQEVLSVLEAFDVTGDRGRLGVLGHVFKQF
jgi:hypothetical protein